MYKYSVVVEYSLGNKREYLFKTEVDADKFCLSMKNASISGLRKKEVKVKAS